MAQKKAPYISLMAVLTLVTGCGASNSPASGNASPAASASASALEASPVSAPLTRAQLEAAAVGASDLPGYQYQVEVPQKDTSPQGGTMVSASNPACQPIVEAMVGRSETIPQAFVDRSVAVKTPSGTIRIRLASERPEDAVRVLSDLSSALTACKDAHITATIGGEKDAIDITEYQGKKFGQQSVSVRIGLKVQGQTLPLLLDIGRKGSTVVYFYAQSMTGDLSAPLASVEQTQSAKLSKASN